MALIIDANTPTCCGGCFFLDYDTNERPRCFLCGADITKNVREQTKLPICPIIGEIPDSHGRLIDADAFIEEYKDWVGGSMNDMICELNFAPVIVEATE